ncbi:JmjC domain-containing protein [Streptomyces sp. NPDC003006]
MNVQQPLGESDLQTLNVPGQSAAPGAVRLPDGADVAANLVKELGDVWGKRSLHRQAAVDTSVLLTPHDLDHLIDARILRVSNLWVCRMGQNLPPSTYMRVGEQTKKRSMGSNDDVRRVLSLASEGTPDPVKVAELLAGGDSLTLNQVDSYVPALRAMCQQFEKETHLRCGVILFVTPPSSQAFNVHADPHDIIVMQTYGTKYWEIHPTLWEKENDPTAKVRKIIMHPGDMLYVPEGTPHMAKTTDDGLSIHQTVQFRVPRYASLAKDILLRAFEEHCDNVGMGGPIPYPRGNEAELAQHLQTSIKEFAASLTDSDISALLAGHLEKTEPKPRTLASGRIAQIAAADSVTGNTPLRLTWPLKITRSAEEDSVQVLFGRRGLKLPAQAETYLRAISQTDAAFTAVGLTGDLDETSRLLVCRRLVREGVLTLTD